MERNKLLNILATVEPALAATDLLPILTHFWFTGEEVMAYNDVIALSIPFETEFTAAIKGSVLKALLTKATHKEVEMDISKDQVNVKCGRVKMTMPILSSESFLFEFPEVSEDDVLPVDPEQFAQGLDVCLQSLGAHISEPERKGILIEAAGKKSLNLYSTDSVTMSHAIVNTKTAHGVKEHFTISESFCDMAVKLMKKKGGKDFTLYAAEDYVLLRMKDKTRLYGRILDDNTPPKFAKVLADYTPSDPDNMLMDIPKDFSQLLDRAFIVISKALDPVTTLGVGPSKRGKDGSVLRLRSKSENGEVKDSIPLGASHPEVSVGIDLSRFRECDFGKFDKFMIDERCILLRKGKKCTHLVSVLDR